MTEPAQDGEQQGGAERFNVSMDGRLASRVDEAAREEGASRSAEMRDLACRGLAAMRRDNAADGVAIIVRMEDDNAVPLTPELVERDVLPACATVACDEAGWLEAVPEGVRSAMTEEVIAAASGLGAHELPLGTVTSVASVLATDPACPWMVSSRTRKQAVAQAARDVERLSADEDASVSELTSAAARRLLYPACDVVGVEPDGPVQVLAEVLGVAAGDSELLTNARSWLQRILGTTDGEMAKLAQAAETLASGDADITEVDAAARLLVRWAQALDSEVPRRAKNAPSSPRRCAAFKPRGAEEIVALATDRPRATLPELEAAAGISHSTLQRRLAELESAGIMRNEGTARQPLWVVTGAEHDPEDLLTEVQRKVLDAVRKDPLKLRTDVAAELGVSLSLVSKAYHELAYLGLVKKSGRGWVATEQKGGTC